MSDGIEGMQSFQAKEVFAITSRVFAWKWTLNGRWNEISFHCDHAPNFLHRVLQRLILGIHWERSK